MALLAAVALGMPGAAAGSPASSQPAVRALDSVGYQEILAAHKGKILVVNFWATWCEPCREEFPELVKLHKEWGGRGVVVVAVSLDAASELDKAVLPFLKEQGVTFASYIKSPGDDDAFINAVDPKWSGALPTTFVHDRDGKLVRALMGKVTVQRVMDVVKPMLK